MKDNSASPQRVLCPAVLFLVFNRPELTRRVFDAIKAAKPNKLYIAADGPRSERKGEAELCEATRAIASSVDWDCEVKTLFRKTNLGCERAVSSAISWFFESETEGIILEDDCLPHPDFFGYCAELLRRYADDHRVWVITGDNFQDGERRGAASYYFSKYNHVWGWATWRRSWQFYDSKLSFLDEWRESDSWDHWLPLEREQLYWSEVFDSVREQRVDTWDYPWTACVWRHGGLTATPNVNLVSNIGFGSDATHTKQISRFSAMPTNGIGTISHPEHVELNSQADAYVFQNCFASDISPKVAGTFRAFLDALKRIRSR